MRKKMLPIILAILIFSAMITLIFSARAVHNSMIPNVKVSRLTRQEFEYEVELNNELLGFTNRIIQTKVSYAIPKELYDSGKVFIIGHDEINGDIRTVAMSYNIEIRLENDEYYEVANRFFGGTPLFIMESNKEIEEGTEVYVVE